MKYVLICTEIEERGEHTTRYFDTFSFEELCMKAHALYFTNGRDKEKGDQPTFEDINAYTLSNITGEELAMLLAIGKGAELAGGLYEERFVKREPKPLEIDKESLAKKRPKDTEIVK